MHQHNEGPSKSLINNLNGSVDFFGMILSVPQEAVPSRMKTEALLRRVSLSFIALYEYLREKSSVKQDMHNKPLEELADFFIKEKSLMPEDKESFVKLGNVYGVLRWPAPGMSIDTNKVLEHIPDIYAFLKRFVEAHPSLSHECHEGHEHP